MSVSGTQFDVLIIGGGINGVGVARDCVLRGLRTALVEAEDFASGATGASTGLIHGGPRYLETDIQTTYHSCLDSGYVQKQAPQLLFRVPFLVPWKKGEVLLPELMETFFTAYDRFSALKNGKPHTRLTREDCLTIEPGLTADVDGAISFDEWGVNPARLTYLNLLDASENGLEVFNHAEVFEMLKDDARITGVRARRKSGEILQLSARVTVNLTGPWAPQLGRLAGVDIQVRPSKGVHLVLDRRYLNVGITCEGIDGRDQMFILPHENTTLIGATDDDYFGDPRNIPITEDEIAYILDAASRAVPEIKNARVIRAFAGIRPTLYQRGKYESDLSRAHRIIDHEIVDKVPGLITMIGGKLAAYRLMSEECTDLVMDKLNKKGACATATRLLPGGQKLDDAELQALQKKTGIPMFALSRLRYRHGSETGAVLASGEKKIGALASEFACTCEPVTFAEAMHSLSEEHCGSLNDLRRRTRFGMGPCSGLGCTANGAHCMVLTHDLNAEEWAEHIRIFLQRRFQGRQGALFSPDTAAQEEYIRGVYCLSGGISTEGSPVGFLDGLL